MEKFKEIANDPVKLEASLKDSWAKISKGAASITHEQFKVGAEEFAKTLNLPKGPEPTEAEKEAAKKLVDPNGTGKVDFEGFRKLVLAGIEKAKKEGKL